MVFTLLGGFLVGVARSESDALSVLRPCESVYAVLGLGQLRGLAAVGIDDEDLILVADSVAGEGEPFARGRPLRIAGGLFAARDLKRLARRRVRQPDLRDEGVLLPVRLADGVGDVFTVRRDLRAAEGLDVEQVVNCGDSFLSLNGQRECDDNESQSYCAFVHRFLLSSAGDSVKEVWQGVL